MPLDSDRCSRCEILTPLLARYSYHADGSPDTRSVDALYNRLTMAIIEIEGLAKSYRVYQKQEGLLASRARAVSPQYRDVAGRRAASTCASRAASSSPFSGPTAPARPPRSSCSPA